MKTIFPPPLKPGGTIGVVAPSCWPRPERLAAGKALLEKYGYRTVIHPQVRMRDGQMAGDDAMRSKAIMQMFTDPGIDAVWCARGGNGAIRILDRLDYRLIARHPKPIIGYSDITLLLHAIQKKCGFVTYHGPLFTTPCTPRGIKQMFAVVGGGGKYAMHFPGVVCVKSGKAQGVLIGGNISLLQSLIGTPYDWSARNGILFIEDTGEPLYRLDRMLRHMKLAGKFKGLRAVIASEMAEIYDGETAFGRTSEARYGRSWRQILQEIFPDIPLCINFPCGHGRWLTTLPVGAEVKLSITTKGVEISFNRE